jgi:hypothetical protein
VAPLDVHCEGFDLTYTRINCSAPTNSINKDKHGNGVSSSTFISRDERKVNESIEGFLKNLKPIGPELLRGKITLSFFERRSSRQLFGLIAHDEKVM